MSSWLSRLFNSSDRSVESHIVFTFLALIATIAYTGWHLIVLHNPFAAADFGQGVGVILGGGGVAAWGQGSQSKAAAGAGNEPN